MYFFRIDQVYVPRKSTPKSRFGSLKPKTPPNFESNMSASNNNNDENKNAPCAVCGRDHTKSRVEAFPSAGAFDFVRDVVYDPTKPLKDQIQICSDHSIEQTMTTVCIHNMRFVLSCKEDYITTDSTFCLSAVVEVDDPKSRFVLKRKESKILNLKHVIGVDSSAAHIFGVAQLEAVFNNRHELGPLTQDEIRQSLPRQPDRKAFEDAFLKMFTDVGLRAEVIRPGGAAAAAAPVPETAPPRQESKEEGKKTASEDVPPLEDETDEENEQEIEATTADDVITTMTETQGL
jgi:hypothetical protein